MFAIQKWKELRVFYGICIKIILLQQCLAVKSNLHCQPEVSINFIAFKWKQNDSWWIVIRTCSLLGDLKEYFGLLSTAYLLGKQGIEVNRLQQIKWDTLRACLIQIPCIQEVTFSNSWKTRMIFFSELDIEFFSSFNNLPQSNCANSKFWGTSMIQ